MRAINRIAISLTIGRLAAAAGVRASTVRYYERAGLLQAESRTRGNYRSYNAAALERLHFIRSAQAIGFSVRDIGELLKLTRSSEPPCNEVRALLQHRLEDIQKRLKELRDIQKILARTLKVCCSGGGPDLCDEIVRLKNPSHTARCASACGAIT